METAAPLHCPPALPIVTLAAVALGVYAEPGAAREASLSNAEPWYIPLALLRQRRQTFRRLRAGASVGGD